MNSHKADYLQSIEVFQDLSETEIEDLEHQTRMVSYKSGHLFFMPDDPGEVLFILKKGRVQLYRMSPEGRKLVIVILQPGVIFGHMALVGQRMHNTYAEALDDCTICVWSRAAVEHLLLQKPQVALRLLNAISQRLAQIEERLTDLTFKRVPARLASLLLQLDQQNGGNGVLQGYTHQYLAEMVGTYRETATQTLNDFKQRKLIEVSRKKIIILNEGELEKIAAES